MKKNCYQIVFDKKTKEVFRIRTDAGIINKDLFIFGNHFTSAEVDLYIEFINAQIYYFNQIKPKWKPDIYFFLEQCEHLNLLLTTYEEKVRYVRN